MLLSIQLIPKAYRDLDRIYNQIADFISEDSAEQVITDIYSLIDLAAENPEMGSPGIIEGTRELFPRGENIESFMNLTLKTCMY